MNQDSPVVSSMLQSDCHGDFMIFLEGNPTFRLLLNSGQLALIQPEDLAQIVKAEVQRSILAFRCCFKTTAGHLLAQSLDFYNRFQISCIGNGSLFQNFIIAYSQTFTHLRRIRVWDSQLGPLFFQTLRGTKWEIESLQFLNCQIGNSLGPLIRQKLRPPIIRSIVLGSDPISNRGVGQLMRLDLACLEVLVLINTDITNDAVKLFNKKRGQYSLLAIQDQYMFQHLPFFKQGLSVCRPPIRQYKLKGKNSSEQSKIFYLPQGAKMSLNPRSSFCHNLQTLSATSTDCNFSSKGQHSMLNQFCDIRYCFSLDQCWVPGHE